MRKWIMSVLALGMLSGCWDNKDINHRSLPIAIGIAMNDGKYDIYLKIPVISETQNKFRIVYGRGNTINEVIDRISMNMESQIDLLHLKVILFDKKFAEKGLEESISSIVRSRHIAAKTMIVISDEPLKQFFDNLSRNNLGDGTTLYTFFQKNAGWSPEVAYTQTWKIFRSIHSMTNDVVVPIVRSGTSTMIESTGSAIMKNGKMVGRLTNEETLLANVFDGLNTQGKIEVMGHSTVQIVSNRLGVRSSIQGNTPRLTITLFLKTIVLDTRGNPSMDEIKTEVEKKVSKQFEGVFAKIKASEADFLGLGQHFRNDLTRQQLERWRNEYLPRVQIDFHVKTTIRNSGNLKADVS